MTDASTERAIATTISGGQIQGVAGAGSVVIENFTIYNRAPDEQAGSEAAAGPIPECPYPGLAYFGPGDTHLFFGRDAAITRLAAAVDRRSLTVLAGASGSGKSSVVLAGLAPRLNAAGNWRFSHFRIGAELDSNPFLALARALAPLYVASDSDVERLKNTKMLAACLQSGELTLRDIFADCRSRNKGRRILLIADQFEEAFTQVGDEAVSAKFIDVLLAGFPDPPPGGTPDICLVLTLRADFYGRALRHRPLADAMQGHVENLGPMKREELQEAIVRPAKDVGVTFEPGLVDTLLDTVQSQAGGLPLLQFALREMWARQERKTLTRKSYDEIGGVGGALAQRAETVFAGLTQGGADASMDKAFQRLFTRLVSLGEGREDTRRVVERGEIGATDWGLAQRLADEQNRLVVTNASSARETAEVVHEALIRHWPRLVDWVNRDRAFQTWLRQIGSNIELWAAHPDDDGTLLRGGMLAQAIDWLARRRDDLSPTELAYIEASIELRRKAEAEKEAAHQAELKRQQDERDQARRRQRQAAVAAVFFLALAIAAGAAGVVAYQARHDALAERDKATRNFVLARQAADSLVADIAGGLRDVQGMSAEAVRKVLETAKGTFEQLAAAAPDDADLQRGRAQMLAQFGMTYETLGDLGSALQAYRASLAIAERLAATDSTNAAWQRDLSLSYVRIGDVLFNQGQLDEALKSYRASLANAERLTAADRSNTQWQRDLSTSYVKIGFVLEQQGQLDEALKSFRASLAIAERLAAADRSNTQWERDLSVSYSGIGGVLEQQGQLEEALKSYRASLTIRERLAAADRSHTQWQRDLSVSYNDIGDLLVQRGQLDEALKSYRASLAIGERLAAADGSNTQWQRDLSVSYDGIGDVLVQQRQLEEALKSYRASLAIGERLAAADRSNTRWQRDLSISYDKIGSVLAAQGQLDEALKSFRARLAIAERLAAADRSNTQWQRDLSTSYDMIGGVLDQQGQRDEALKSYRASLAIRERLTAADRSNTQWQGDLQNSIGSVGSLAYRFVLAGEFAKALEAADQAISLAPEKIWLYTNRAHALMFLGRVDEARALYLQYRGQESRPSKPWEASILGDFSELRQEGLTHPLMDEIEAKLAAREGSAAATSPPAAPR